ncbi:MAG: hypothetical protein LKI28_05120 [Ancrocorticia sp.]|jgi:hypothetical protein|nr:hypothetical protein [Ancrocorticia sp.]
MAAHISVPNRERTETVPMYYWTVAALFMGAMCLTPYLSFLPVGPFVQTIAVVALLGGEVAVLRRMMGANSVRHAPRSVKHILRLAGFVAIVLCLFLVEWALFDAGALWGPSVVAIGVFLFVERTGPLLGTADVPAAR